jgi:hypothetical protein
MTIAEQLSHIEQLLIISSKAVLNTREVAIMLGVTEDRVRHLVSAVTSSPYTEPP